MTKIPKIDLTLRGAITRHLDGSGTDYCEDCGGDGFIEHTEHGSINDEEPTYYDVPCETCKGTGYPLPKKDSDT